MNEENSAEAMAELKNNAGLHVRPARELSDEAKQFEASISIRPDDSPESDAVDAKSIMQLLTLGIPNGTRIVVSASGEDAEQAVERISEMIEDTWN